MFAWHIVAIKTSYAIKWQLFEINYNCRGLTNVKQFGTLVGTILWVYIVYGGRTLAGHSITMDVTILLIIIVFGTYLPAKIRWRCCCYWCFPIPLKRKKRLQEVYTFLKITSAPGVVSDRKPLVIIFFLYPLLNSFKIIYNNVVVIRVPIIIRYIITQCYKK